MNTNIALFPGFYGSMVETDSAIIPYPEFAKCPPRLYGQIIVNRTAKIGSFRPAWNRYTNNLEYQYYTPQGNKGKGGFSMVRAWNLLKSGGLSLDEKYGNPDTYL